MGKDPSLSRRAFLGGAMAAVAISLDKRQPRLGSLLPSVLEEARNTGRTLTNEALEFLPTHLPGAAAVEKVIIPGAKRTLVHVRNAHVIVDPTTGISFISEDTRTAQKDICRILNCLIDLGHLRRVYAEGAGPEDSFHATRGMPGRRLEACRAILHEPLFNRNMTADVSGKLEAFLRSYFQLRPTVSPRTMRANCAQTLEDYEFDAVSHLFLEHRICEVIPVDHPEAVQLLLEQVRYLFGHSASPTPPSLGSIHLTGRLAEFHAAWLNDPENLWRMWAQEPALVAMDEASLDALRENTVLTNIAAICTEPLSVLVFGAWHDFSDNLRVWNALYPDDRFSYCVITPEALMTDPRVASRVQRRQTSL